MSKRLDAKINCPKCHHEYDFTVYRSIWGEIPENRDLVMSDKINVAKCPSCEHSVKLEVPLMYTNTNQGFAVWWEPHHDPQIDIEIQESEKNIPYLKHAQYLVKAPRIKDWGKFKDTIIQFENGESNTKNNQDTAPLESKSEQKKPKKRNTTEAQYKVEFEDGKIKVANNKIAIPAKKESSEQGQKKSAGLDTSKAQYNLADRYKDGVGVSQSDENAIYWYKKSAIQGNSSAQLSLGHMYDMKNKYEEAFYWYKKSAEQGNPRAQYNLGSKYIFGFGVGKDYVKAKHWMEKARDNSDEYASKKATKSIERYKLLEGGMALNCWKKLKTKS